ncbi:MAG: permease [Candidatus Omnitrophota bacterium]
MIIADFFSVFKTYSIEMLPALAIGLLISGVIHEFIPDDWVEKYMSKKGLMPIFFATIIGTIVPVCCWGSLPIAVSFHKKGASLGPIFAFLAATPATSVNALIVSWRFMGLKFTAYIFFAVILIGMAVGIIGNFIRIKPGKKPSGAIKAQGEKGGDCHSCCKEKTPQKRVRSVLKYAFFDMPKEIGLEILAGIGLAALVSTIAPIGAWIKSYLTRGYGYLFSLVFGLIVYMCATMSVPLVHAFMKQGLNAGSGMSLLILGPIVSYGTILVLKKEFGFRALSVFLVSVSGLCLLAGYLYSLL